MKTRLIFALSLLSFTQAVPSQTAGPPMPFVERGICPGEGCIYRDWTALNSVVAVDYPDSTWEFGEPASGLKQVFTIKPGEVVTAMTGVIVGTAAGHARSKARQTHAFDPNFPRATGPPVTLAAGDTLYLLGYRGEGSYVAWVRGQLVWFDDVTDGTVLDPPQSIWWVQIRNARGQIGWTTERDEFANTNSLIRPPEPTSMFVYWMSDRPWTELKPGVHIRPIVGETGTFTVAELDPGAETFVHHHTQEQLNVGLSAGNEISRAGHVHSLGVGVATVTPPDVEHFIRNAGPGKAMLLEYQPIRRFDLLPPRPAPAYASAPQAISMTEKQLPELEIGSASAAWIAEPNGVRTTVMAGQRALLTVMDVPAAVRQPVNLRPQAVSAEQFFYVLAGDVRLSVGADAYRVSAGSAFLVPRRAVAVQLRLISRDARLLRFDVK